MDCPDENCRKQQDADHKEIKKLHDWKTTMKAYGAIGSMLFALALVGLGIWANWKSDSIVRAQSSVDAKTIAIEEKNDAQDNRLTALEVAVGEIKANANRVEEKVGTAIERADEDRQRSKEQQKAILEAIRDLNKDD